MKDLLLRLSASFLGSALTGVGIHGFTYAALILTLMAGSLAFMMGVCFEFILYRAAQERQRH